MTENRLVSLEVLYDIEQTGVTGSVVCQRTDWCHWKCYMTENRLVSLEVLYDREQTGVTGSVVTENRLVSLEVL